MYKNQIPHQLSTLLPMTVDTSPDTDIGGKMDSNTEMEELEHYKR
jgi:hypothetical protein